MNIIIVGAGMTGAILALAISCFTQGKITIELVENIPYEYYRKIDLDRAIALARGTCQQLASIDVWPIFQYYTTKIKKIQVSELGHAGFLNLHAHDYHVDALGHVLKLHDARVQLYKMFHHSPGLKLHCPAKVMDVFYTNKQAKVLLNNGRRLNGQLLVAADGSNSLLAQVRNITLQCKNTHYLYAATIAKITTSEDPQGRAFELFTSQGPIAMLPISHGRSFLVWCHSLETSKKVAIWEEKYFLNKLQKYFGFLGKILQVENRNIFPMSMFTVKKPISHRLALVGNAAQTIHPISGQGLNLGLRDVMWLAENLTSAAQEESDIGIYPLLSNYQNNRKKDRKYIIILTEGLIYIFTHPRASLVVGRNICIIIIKNLTILRTIFSKRLFC